MKVDRLWQMPNHRTFEIPAIKKLIRDELENKFLDPFPYPFTQDAIKYLQTFSENSITSLCFDPPYSQRQLKEMYHDIGFSYEMNNSYWSKCKDEIARIMKPGGKVVSFGWNSNGIGKKRGFEITRILLVAHGSQHNDTICTVEVKTRSTLD